MFSDNGGHPAVTSSSLLSEGRSWRATAEMTGADGIIDFSSVVSFNGNMYALDSEGGIMSLILNSVERPGFLRLKRN